MQNQSCMEPPGNTSCDSTMQRPGPGNWCSPSRKQCRHIIPKPIPSNLVVCVPFLQANNQACLHMRTCHTQPRFWKGGSLCFERHTHMPLLFVSRGIRTCPLHPFLFNNKHTMHGVGPPTPPPPPHHLQTQCSHDGFGGYLRVLHRMIFLIQSSLARLKKRGGEGGLGGGPDCPKHNACMTGLDLEGVRMFFMALSSS